MNKNSLRQLTFLSGAAALLISVQFASAVLLPPGTSSSAPDIFISGGQTILGAAGFSGAFGNPAGSASYTVTEYVFRDPLNVFGANNLDFMYQVQFQTDSFSFLRLNGSSFAGFLTDVGFTPNGSALSVFSDGTITPTQVDRDATGAVVGFNFLQAPTGTATTVVLEIQTNATIFGPGSMTITFGGTGVDGGTSSFTGNGIAPVAPPSVPDSGNTAILLAFSMIGFLAAYRGLGRHSIA